MSGRAYVLSEEDARLLEELLRRSQGLVRPGQGPAPAPTRLLPREPSQNGVLLTSLSPTAGRYSGHWGYRDTANEVWVDSGEAVWVEEANGQPLALGTWYLGRAGDDVSGQSVYTVWAGSCLAGGQAGTLVVSGGVIVNALPTPAAPAVTVIGVAGTTTWAYAITALSLQGETLASVTTTITTGNATLSSANYNAVSWAAVVGAATYNVYRVTAGGAPASTGKIGSTTAPTTTFPDTGLAAAGTLPVAGASGLVTLNQGLTVAAGAVAYLSGVAATFQSGSTLTLQAGSTVSNQAATTYGASYAGTYQSGSSNTYQSGSTLTLQAGSTLSLSATTTVAAGSWTWSSAGSFTVSAGTWNFGSTVNVTAGPWTISGGTAFTWSSTGAFTFAGGKLVFGQTTSVTVAPPGVLVIPVITGYQKATYVAQNGAVLCAGKWYGQYDEAKPGWWWYSPDPTTAKGDLIIGVAGDVPARLPVGANYLPLVADSTQTLGLHYAILPPQGGGTGIDSSAVADGQLLLGKGSDHTWHLGTLTSSNASITITPGPGTLDLKTAGGGGAAAPAWVKVSLTYTAFTALGAVTAGSANLYTLPVGGVVHDVYVELTAAFTAPALTVASLAVGYTGNTGYFTTSGDAHNGVPYTIICTFSHTGGATASSSAVLSLTATTQLTADLTLTGDTMNNLTAGAITVWLLVSTLP